MDYFKILDFYFSVFVATFYFEFCVFFSNESFPILKVTWKAATFAKPTPLF